MTNEIRISSTVDTKKLTKNQVAALKALLAAGAPVTLPRWARTSQTIAGQKVTYLSLGTLSERALVQMELTDQEVTYSLTDAGRACAEGK